jgi:hypothetical protein
MVYQSNAYFERCHTADFDPEVSVEKRRKCWAKWLEHYTVGQPPERVQYARQRLHALERGETMDPLPGLGPVGTSYRASFLTSRPAQRSAGGEGASSDRGARGTTQKADGGTSAASTDGGTSVAVADGGVAEAGASISATADAGADAAKDAREVDIPSPPDDDQHPGPCATVCDPRWRACARRCTGPEADSCLEACKSEYRLCMGGCY